MKGEWCYFKSHFTDEQCDLILESGLLLPSQTAKMGIDNTWEDPSYRKSDIRWIYQTEEFNWLFDEMWKLAIKANHDWFDFHISNLGHMQLAEYDESNNGEYKDHADTFWGAYLPYHRKLTAIIQLTDPDEYEGGDFELVDAQEYFDADDVRERGTVVFIPSPVLHRATPVTSGTRHSIACWFEGPHWR